MSHPTQRSTIVPQTSRKNERGDIRRGGDATRHPELGFKGCRTLYEGFRRGHNINPLGACLGFRAISTNGLATPYIYSSYTEVLARINAFAAGLDTLNLVPPTNKDDGEMILVGLYMKNCMEWFIAEQAIFCVSGATVPFYDTLGPESVQFILKQTSTKTVVSTRKELQRLCTVKKSGLCPYFEVVVLVDGVTAHAAKIAKEAGLSVMSFAKVEAGTLLLFVSLSLSPYVRIDCRYNTIRYTFMFFHARILLQSYSDSPYKYTHISFDDTLKNKMKS